MASMIDVVFPRKVTNEYRGGAVPFYGFCLLFAMQIFKSTVHLLKPDSGVNSIASIIVFPFEGPADPNNVIYMFSAVGGGGPDDVHHSLCARSMALSKPASVDALLHAARDALWHRCDDDAPAHAGLLPIHPACNDRADSAAHRDPHTDLYGNSKIKDTDGGESFSLE